ncbi:MULTISPECIES: iron ABC transporter permease [Dehalobacter]|jgi:iron complex transport system permease protein|uniref:Iron chelate uptake ABC transporter family permease subunit n=2 Tax=Dehalobacter restrictus TaxID=55583 RepID=A0A857DFJ5_9FIRM|nr:MULTISPECIES: iron ABC transporter permease [Dehalobacter]AHF08950.1 iron ABC transporter permease [Dehalobacter restrictus DSM 9455]MDJ0306141.1 iron ABC transporter permease [Dehalobacter sp.]OCZ51902.1 iron ABC transporter permease [Dehalobacter sp. TeCB1]QGZ99470.1 iron chelate uptake ABC transporter family permease subunit [Dehalobacter restrictus]
MDQQRLKLKMHVFFIIILALLATMVFLLNISAGSVNISLEHIIKILTGHETGNDTYASIVMNIRLPRALATLVGGACLAVAGLLLQIFFRNPIVEPYVLGISSGASLFVGLVVLGGYTFGMTHMTPMFLFGGAFLGAMVVMLVVVLAAKKVRNITTLLIIGLMAGFICSAMTSMLTAFADKEKIHAFMMWTLGSFSGFSWTQVECLYLIGVPFLLMSLLICKPLNAMLFGEKYALSMGLNIKRFRMLVILISSVLTAVITAFAGPVSFVGLAVPHMVRISFGTSDNRVLLPGVILAGALMTGICDLGARMLMAPTELPLSAITSLIGAPIVVYLLLRKGSEL